MMTFSNQLLGRAAVLAAGLALVSCGAASVGLAESGIAVEVSPRSVAVNPGGSVPFTATVSGPVGNTRTVNWTVDPAGGAIDSDGIFHASGALGTFEVTATSIADTTAAATASVVVTNAPVVTVTVTPRTTTAVQGKTAQLASAVSGAGATTTAVTWTVDQTNAGSVNATGLYSASGGAGSFTVRATSVADTRVSATATITVTAPPPIQVQVSPVPATVVTSGTLQFSGTVLNVPSGQSTAVTWAAPDTNGGTIDASGLYHAPATAGTYHVRATSVANTSVSALVAVTVTASGSLTQAQKVAIVATKRWIFYHMSTGCNFTGGAWSGVDANQLVHDMVFSGTQPCGLYKQVKDAGGGLRVVHPPYQSNQSAYPDDAPNSSTNGQGAGTFTAGTFWHMHVIAANESVGNKIVAFDQHLRAYLGPKGSAQALARVSTSNPIYAGVKFCWVDDWTADIVTRLFPTYRSTMAALEADYPGLHIMHFAAPLQPTDTARNGYRVGWSNQLRATYPGWVFDTDVVESTRQDGSTYTYGGNRAIAPEWNGDAPNGHLSEAGTNWVGSKLLDFLAAVAQL